MNLYELASLGETEGAGAASDTPYAWLAQWSAPEELDAAFDAAASEYGVDADVLRAMALAGGRSGSSSGQEAGRTDALGLMQLTPELAGNLGVDPLDPVQSIFGAAASLRSRLEAFDGDYTRAVAANREGGEGGEGGTDGDPFAPGGGPPQAPAGAQDYLQTVFAVADDLKQRGAGYGTAPASLPASASGPSPSPPRVQAPAAQPPQPPQPVGKPVPLPQGVVPSTAGAGRGTADDPRSLLLHQAPALKKPFADEVKSQLGTGAKTLAQMLPGTGAAARWVASPPEAAAGKPASANPGSVLERAAPPADLPTASFAPVRPEVRQAFGNAWDAASPEERQRMQLLDGWQGQLARERAGLFARADEGALSRSPTATLLDTRAESRTKALTAKGEHPDFARRAAREGAAAGVAPGQEIKALAGTVQPSTYDFGTKNLFDPGQPGNLLNNAAVRGVAKGGLGLAKGVVGLSEAIEDLTGADDATKQRTAARATSLRGMEQAIGERGTHLQRNFEGAVASVTQQLPMLVTGSFVPSQLLGLGGMAVQSFGQEYSDGKSRGLDPEQAAGRAGAFAAFEVIGEKFGFKGNMDAIRKATQGMHGDALAGFLSNLVKKEVPGEVLTTTGQFAVDKWAPAGMALSPNATFGDYFRQVGDTITQTVMMGGGRHAIGAMGAAAPSTPRVQEQPTTPEAPPVPPPLAADEAPTPGSQSMAAGYSGDPVPGSAIWSQVAAAEKKAQAEAEILRQADALPAPDAPARTAGTTDPAAPSTTPAAAMPAAMDNSNSSSGGSAQQDVNALPQALGTGDTAQAGEFPVATVADPTANPSAAPAPASSVANVGAGAAETVPTADQQGAVRHTAAAQAQAPAPVQVQVQALDSGMLVVRGDQAAIQSRLQAGGVDGARSFSGVTVVPVEQAALARRVLSAPPVESAHRQVGGGPARALAVANAAQQKAASPQGAQQAPEVHRGEPAASSTFAGARTAGTNAAGPAVSPTSQGPQAGPQASAADVRALPPAPAQMEPLRDGTLMVRGDAKLIRARLLAGGVDRVIERKGGIVVGLDQVDKARKVLLAAARPQSSTRPSRQGQQFSRSAPPAPDQASQAKGLPSQPATVQSVRAAVARLTNSMGLLAGGRGRVVVATSANIKAHWEPLIGEVDIGLQDTGLAHGFYDPETKTVFLIADHIEAGQEMAVAAHELMHKHGKAVLGAEGWKRLQSTVEMWADAPDGSTERQVYDEAVARVEASRPSDISIPEYTGQELLPYAVQVALEMGVQPTAMRPITTVQGWLARVRAAIRTAWDKLTSHPELFDSQDLVNLAFGIAQRENPATGTALDNVTAEHAQTAAEALAQISTTDGLFALPKSDATTVEQLAAEMDPDIQVTTTPLGDETMYTLKMADESMATLTERAPSPDAVYGQNEATGRWISERPGENAAAAAGNGDVWIDVSGLKPGRAGGMVYNLAANYAHNTGKVFIGDPSGLSDLALRRRAEQMLSSALKFGTTEHLAPHPRQTVGDAGLGVPPLRWVYGDDAANIQALIDVNQAALDNEAPYAKYITYDLQDGTFRDSRTGEVVEGRGIDAAANGSRDAGALAQPSAGWRTIARGSVFRAILDRGAGARQGESGSERGEPGPGRGEVLDGVVRQPDRFAQARDREQQRSRGTLAGLAGAGDRLASGDREQRIFYSRNGAVAPAAAQRSALPEESTGQAPLSTLRTVGSDRPGGPAMRPASQGPQAGAADVGALPPAPVQMEPLRDGTLMVRGDAKEIRARLLAGGVDRVIERRGGLVVGIDQVGKARQLLAGTPQPVQDRNRAAPPVTGHDGSPTHAPHAKSSRNGLPSQPATAQSVRAAVARLTNSMGLLAGGRGRVVATTSDEIKEHWEPLIGEVDIGSQDTGLAQGFYDPETKTVFLIADHIEAGQEMAVAAHELMHKHGKAVLGEKGWRQLHEVIGTWAGKPEGSLERQVYDEAVARVRASRPDGANADTYSSEELFPYAVQVAMELGVEPTAMRPITTVQGWLARVLETLGRVWTMLSSRPDLFESQDLVDLAFAIAQQENPALANALDDAVATFTPDENGDLDHAGTAGTARLRNVYIPRDEFGKLIPMAQRTVDGVGNVPLPLTEAEGTPHTVLSAKIGEDGQTIYRQTATFPGGVWPPLDGADIPWSRVDWTDHAYLKDRENSHPNPHGHQYYYDPVQKKWRSGSGTPFWGH